MGQLIYTLFVSFCLFVISMSGFTMALAMWRKSNSLCDKCRKELNK